MLKSIDQMQLSAIHSRYSEQSSVLLEPCRYFDPCSAALFCHTLMYLAHPPSAPLQPLPHASPKLRISMRTQPPISAHTGFTQQSQQYLHLLSLSRLFDPIQTVHMGIWHTLGIQARWENDFKAVWRGSHAYNSSQFKGSPISACSTHC